MTSRTSTKSDCGEPVVPSDATSGTKVRFGLVRSKAIAIACLLLSACTALDTFAVNPSNATEVASSIVSPDFERYREDTIRLMREKRAFQGDEASEVAMNAPREWHPPSSAHNGRVQKGILLVHGLGDSPWSYSDIGPELAKRGFLVRTVLLSGHGTRPDDLMNVTLEDWRRVVQEQAETMRRDVGEVYLGGFSTGANLVLEYAYDHHDIAGLVLFSPGFKSLPLSWMAPALAKVRPWLIRPDEGQSIQNSVRYLMVPTNGFAQFYYSSRAAQRLLARKPYDKPVFMVVAEHDSVLDTGYLLKTFQDRFIHPDSRLVWYGKAPAKLSQPERVLVQNDHLPELRISQFSHMGLMFSPSNPLYGQGGSLRFCFNGQSRHATEACEAGALVWYSDWGYDEKDKVHARLTFNPYFTWQTSVMASVLDAARLDKRSSASAISIGHYPAASSRRNLRAQQSFQQ